MSRVKLRWFTIVALVVLLALTLGFAYNALPKGRVAHASTASPTSIFSGVDGTIGNNRPETPEEDEDYYVQFSLGDGDSVYFRRNLALKWFESEFGPVEEDEEDEDEAEKVSESALDLGVKKYFSMSFSFENIAFETFTITFEGSEENFTKDAKSINSLVFEYDYDADELTVAVHDAYWEEGDDVHAYTIGAQKEILTFTIDEEDCDIGEFAVYMQIGTLGPQFIGRFTNIGGNYLQYLSSSTTPITFTADLLDLPQDSAEASVKQKLLMRSLNGQTFEVDDKGLVTDNAAPVLVLNEAVYSINLGEQFSLTFTAIDVIHSVTYSRYYYMAKQDAEDESVGYVKPDTSSKSEDYKSFTANDFILPPDDKSEDELAYVSIRISLSETDRPNTYVYLAWYAVDDAKEVVGTDGNEFLYIIANREAEGPEYTEVVKHAPEYKEDGTLDKKGYNEGPDENDGTSLTANYQLLVDAAASKVSAGKGAYIYLPSLRDLISSEYADYRNLRFSIFYYKPNAVAGSTASSSTSLRYNNLRFEVDQRGVYKFRVIAQDAAGNAMEYYDEDGELVTLTSSNVWDIDGIPEFTFTIKYDGPSIEEAGDQDYGYRDQTYNIDDFDIIAIDGYEKEYTLYHLDTSLMGAEAFIPEYTSLVDNLDSYVAEYLENNYLREIREYNSQVTEDDANAWARTDNNYAWRPSSLSFNPVDSGFYFLKVVVTDGELKIDPTEAWMVINIQNPIDTIPGQSRWLQNNATAIALFAVSAVLLIAIVVLLVIKPSDKKVEEVDLAKLKGRKKGKK